MVYAKGGPAQLWPTSFGGIDPPIVESLRACLAIPGIFKPLPLTEKNRNFWLSHEMATRNKRLYDLVDGVVVRANPLPALFRYLTRQHGGGDAAKKLTVDRSSARPEPRVHLVYSVPIQERALPPLSVGSGCKPDKPDKGLPNIVDGARLGLKLARRRDSRQEVMRTNFITRLVQELGDEGKTQPILPIVVDELAPADDLKFENALEPKEKEILSHAAQGCRRTLATLYPKAVASQSRKCNELLVEIGVGAMGVFDQDGMEPTV